MSVFRHTQSSLRFCCFLKQNFGLLTISGVLVGNQHSMEVRISSENRFRRALGQRTDFKYPLLPEGLLCSRSTDRVKDKDVWIRVSVCLSGVAFWLKSEILIFWDTDTRCKITKPCSRCSDFQICTMCVLKICTMLLFKNCESQHNSSSGHLGPAGVI